MIFLEKCECNALKKPFGKTEFDKLIKKHLNGKHPDSIAETIIVAHEKHVHNKLNTEIQELESKYQGLLDSITDEKGYQKIPVFEKQAQMQYITEREDEIVEAKGLDENRIKSQNCKSYLNNFFKFFKIGHGYFYPALSFLPDGKAGGNESSDNSYFIFLVYIHYKN